MEKLYESSTAEERSAAERGCKELVSKALSGALDAMAHIRRAPVDEEEWRYEVEKLKDRGAFAIACHVAALAHLEHPDEVRAREILEAKLVEAERGIEDSPAMDDDRLPGGHLQSVEGGDRGAWGLRTG